MPAERPDRDVTLRAGHATPTDIVLGPVCNVEPTYGIWLYAGEATPTDIVLRQWPGPLPGGGFPTQFFGLQGYYDGAVYDLCLVAEADGATGMGGVPMIDKSGTVYAVYLVEIGAPNASPIHLQTTTATKAVRLKT